jgi:hypothetical protein
VSQYNTGFARSASGRTTNEPQRVPKPAVAPASETVAPLHGVMTGLANLVNEQLSHLTIGPQATRFLRHLERHTFGNAGLHRRAGHQDPGLWCPYAHVHWAAELDLSSSALTHLRSRLVEAGIIWYTPDPEHRGEGAVGWSFDFASWRPPQWGGARAGAGRPRASPSAGQGVPMLRTRLPPPRSAMLPADREDLVALAHGQSTPSRLRGGDAGPAAPGQRKPHIQDVNERRVAEPSGVFKMSTNTIQDVNETKSRCQRTQFKMSTARPARAGSHQAPAASARMESLKKVQNQRRRTDADASGVASTPPAAPGPLSSLLSDPAHAGAPVRRAHARRAQPSLPPTHSARAGPAGGPLPPPLPYETLRAYWLRIYREASAAPVQERGT